MSLQEKLQQLVSGKLNAEKEKGAEFLKKNLGNAAVVELEGGMQYQVLIEGGGQKPLISETIKAHYKGLLLNGKEFDNSFKRSQPFTAAVRSLIKGWQIALPLMSEGSTWRLWIPSELAYGDRGAGHDIPGGATLVFDVELIEIIK
jgi:FKBP-type peptidyl-prolyl cis-trans isomerase FklB